VSQSYLVLVASLRQPVSENEVQSCCRQPHRGEQSPNKALFRSDLLSPTAQQRAEVADEAGFSPLRSPLFVKWRKPKLDAFCHPGSL